MLNEVKFRSLSVEILLKIILIFIVFLLYLPSYAQVQPIWHSEYLGEIANHNNVCMAIAVDNSGNVYVTGVSDPSDEEIQQKCGYPHICTIKYDGQDGHHIWKTRTAGCGGEDPDNDAYSIAVVTVGSTCTFM